MPSLECEPAREAKHMSLISAKASVNAARNRLRDLYGEVMGIYDAPEDNKAEVTPKNTLVSVLNNTGNEISEIAENIISLTADLRKEIL